MELQKDPAQALMALQATQEIITEFTRTNKKKSHYVNRKLILTFRETCLTSIIQKGLDFTLFYWDAVNKGDSSVAERLYHSLIIVQKCFGYDFK